MCEECGCGQQGPTRVDGQPAEQVPSPLRGDPPAGGDLAGQAHEHPHKHTHEHDHAHPHDHTHPPGELPPPGVPHRHPHTHHHSHPLDHDHDSPDHGHSDVGHQPAPSEIQTHRTLELHQSLLAANDRQAERNRGYFRAFGLLTLNLVSSPGSGKTELIQQTIQRLKGHLRVGVIVGDLATDHDARRLRTTGAPVVQITTGTLCHLDASMVARAVGRLDLKALDVLMIENVGNLVCPAAFDLGEDLRVALLSVTEGEDKPLKYPPLFHSTRAVLVTKMDLAGAAAFPLETALANIRRICPSADLFQVSARTGEGMQVWCDFLVRARSWLGNRPE